MNMSTRADADVQALVFLRDHGPHTLPSPIETEEALCAALIFLDLERRGLASRIDFGNGHIQFSLTAAGRAVLS